MLSTRGARASHDVSVLERMAWNSKDKKISTGGIYIADVLDINMDLSGSDVPLGWYLSATARNRADACVDRFLRKVGQRSGNKTDKSMEALTRGLKGLDRTSCYTSASK